MLSDEERRMFVRIGALGALTPKRAQVMDNAAKAGDLLRALLGLGAAVSVGGGLLAGWTAHKADAATRPSNRPSEERRLREIGLFREAGGRAEAEIGRAVNG